MEQQRPGIAKTTSVSNLMQSSTSSNELVYGGTNSATGSEETPQHVMSDKVQMIASAIYKEFESMISKFGQESVKDMMQLIVNVLENLDTAYQDKDELVIDVEMLKEENEQILNQYERERQMRKSQDQKCLEVEETLVEQNRELESKIESMTSIVRMLELKAKNASDHANRMEEREADQKIEYEKLHDRYNELLRTHIDHVERTKFLMGEHMDMFDMAQSLPLNIKNKNVMAMSAMDGNVRGISDLISAVHMSQSTHADLNLANHISNERDWHEEFGGQQSAAEILATPREQESKPTTVMSRLKIEEKEREGGDEEETELTEEQRVEEGDGISLGADLTGQLVDPAEFASAGMGREVENLIRENTELLETKNALNIVKNDLIAKVDQLTSEQQVFREEVRSLELVKLKLTERIREMENELKELKERKNLEESAEEDIAQRKRFTRVEMARVLMERNQYKEKLIELQDAVKFIELQRAKKNATTNQNKSIIWSFFSNLLGDSTSPASSFRHPHYPAKKTSSSGIKKNIPKSPLNQRKVRTYDSDVDQKHEKIMAERKKYYRALSQHMMDFPNAYGWSMPSTNGTSLSMPVPVNCLPLLENKPELKICCAASCSLYGGLHNDEYIMGDPILGCDPYLLLQNSLQRHSEDNKTVGDLKRLNDGQFSLLESSSLIWICSSNEHQRPFVTILDVNNPAHILEGFSFDDFGARVLCIAGVSGAHETEMRITEEGLSLNSELCSSGGYLKANKVVLDIDHIETFGAVEFIPLQKSQEEGTEMPTYVSKTQTSPSKKRHESDINELQSGDSTLNSTRAILGHSTLHRTQAVLLSENQTGAGEKEEKKQTENEQIQENLEKTDKRPSPLDKLSLHIRNTIRRYENVDKNDILTLPLMWIGLENEFIYIYSAVQEWRTCLRRIRMPDAVLSILQSFGRVFVALADGCIAIFHRDMSGKWSDKGFHLLHLGPADSSVCHLCVVKDKIWAAYRNCVAIFDPVTLKINHTFVAHPRKDSKVREMVPYGNGVWISIRLDSTIRLFDADNFMHLQDLDIGSFITRMLDPNKLDLVLLRITSMTILDKRIWIGTGSGIIVSIPFSEDKPALGDDSGRNKGPGKVVRVIKDTHEKDSTSIIPFGDISKAQLSFHGHREPVRLLIPMHADGFSDLTPNSDSTKLYMLSAGDGYIDFRLGDDESNDKAGDQNSVRVRDMSHLLIWETDCQMNWMGKVN